MGLDMYLRAKRYLWESKSEDTDISKQIVSLLKIPENFRTETISVEVGYWRKANHIHKWFVDNVQEGNDDCGSYFVEKQDLINLKNFCEMVLKDNSVGPNILPTQSGFFFGSTEYDEYYIEDIKSTIEIIDKALSLNDSQWQFLYSSSW